MPKLKRKRRVKLSRKNEWGSSSGWLAAWEDARHQAARMRVEAEAGRAPKLPPPLADEFGLVARSATTPTKLKENERYFGGVLVRTIEKRAKQPRVKRKIKRRSK